MNPKGMDCGEGDPREQEGTREPWRGHGGHWEPPAAGVAFLGGNQGNSVPRGCNNLVVMSSPRGGGQG